MTATTIHDQLPAHLINMGGDPLTAGAEVINTITESIKRQPRSQQIKIGPSEIGQACPRRIAYKLLNTAPREQKPAWKPTIGTAVHEHLEHVFDQYNLDHAHQMGGLERYYVETKVNVGQIGETDINGTADLFDRVTGTNWDYKIVGPKQLRKYKDEGPGPQYRIQAHLYGRGWWRAGVVCTHVGIIFLPRDGELANAHIWTEPYDEQIAIDGLSRVEGIAIGCDAIGADLIEQLQPVNDYCTLCPFYAPGTTNLSTGCPGSSSAAARRDDAIHHQMEGLIDMTSPGNQGETA